MTKGVATGLVALAMGLWSQSLQAQEVPSAGADNQGSPIEDIVVTAQRREERLQDVPLTVNAFSAAALERQGTTKLIDLGAVVPGLLLAKSSTAVQIYLRGVGNPAVAPGNDPSIATYIDGVYNSAPSSMLFSFNNIERVEVLKGPQGTLFGRNATGGLVNIITRDPTAKEQVKASIGYGNYDALQASAYLSGGSDDIAADLSVNYGRQADGWGRNLFDPASAGTVLVNGQPITLPPVTRKAGTLREFGIRSKVVITPGDDTKIKLSATYVETTGDQAIYRHALAGAVLSADGNTPYRFTGGFHDYDSDAPWLGHTEQTILAGEIQHEASFATIKSISSYQIAQGMSFQPSDSTPQVSSAQSNSNTDIKTFTQELQLLSRRDTGPSWLEYTLGLYYLSSDGKYDPVKTVRGYFLEGVSDRYSSQKTESYSAYGQATVRIGERTRVTAGLRFSEDKITGEQYLIGTNTSTIPTPSAVSRAGQISSLVPPQKASFDKLTWRAVIDHRITPDILAYASYNRGYKVGAWNHGAMCRTTPPVGQACTDILPPVKPEVLDAYELGFKSDLFDRRLRLNVAGYYYDYQDLQVQAVVGLPPVNFLTNAASARMYGGDVEIVAAVTDHLTLSANGGYLDAKYRSFPGAPVFVPRSVAPYNNASLTIDASGNRLIKAPKLTTSVSANWSAETSIGKTDVNVNWSHSSSFFWEPSNRVKQKAYDLINLSASLALPDEHWKIRLWGKNLLGTKYYSNVQVSSSGDQGAPGAPFTFGAAVDVSF
jgi:iron complex outermembrane receptor protein